MKVTIKDVAKEAGVSISTVSNALNGVDVLRPATREHILAIAEKLHYIPNLNGRNLKAQATKVIGMFVTYMGGPYMGALADTLAMECRKAGYELNIFVTEQKDTVMANLLGHRVDGAVIVNSSIEKKQEQQLKEAAIPVIYLNREMEGDCQGGVFFDSYQAGRRAAEYLLRRGLKSFGLVDGPANFDSKERSRGFREVLSEQQISLKEEFVWQGGFEREKAFAEVDRFLKGLDTIRAELLPQAIFAVNDLSAIGCMDALMQAGIKVPEQVSVIGCDDIELSRYLKPALTTIRTNFEEQGKVAAGELIRMLSGGEGGKAICLPCELVERESVLK